MNGANAMDDEIRKNNGKQPIRPDGFRSIEFHPKATAMSSLSTLKRTANMMMIIPDDVLLSNILVRLPARQVVQMWCLSKTWNSLLSDPSFIKSHLDRSKDTKDEILMVFEDSRYIEKRPFTEHTITSSQTMDVQLTNSVKVVHTSSSSNSPYGSVVGSVNGLICLYGAGRVKIWNPSLSALIVLPPSTILRLENGNACHVSLCFGFDPKTNDYKVFKLRYYLDDDDMTFKGLPAEVFSLRKGYWKSIVESFPSHVQTVQTMLNRNEVFEDGHDGRLHYLCTSANNDLPTIVAFDLGDETFSEIALPDDCVYRVNELGVLSKKLCVMSCLANGDCEVWVMENYGVATSWAKRHVIPKYAYADVMVPVGITLNNRFLFRHGIHLSLYDLGKSTFRCFKGAIFRCYDAEDPLDYSIKVVPYVDSLIWVTPSKWTYNDVCISSSQKKQKPCLLVGTTNMMMIIPDDVLLSNIFVRLPATQVAQMRCLSKTWNYLLSRPSFIKSHLDRSKDTNNKILMVFEDFFDQKYKPFTEYTISQTDVQLTNSVKVHMDSSNAPYGEVVGSVNGLICLCGKEVQIWNPSLSALIDLPPFTIRLENENDYHVDLRFGFDPKMNDYKVVKLTYYFDLDDDDMTYNWLPVEVFSVRKGSWESITKSFPSHVQQVQPNFTRNEVFVDGHDGRLHYLCSCVNDLPTIVAFDLGDETFSEIAFPDDCVYKVNELAVISQKLCVMSCAGNGDCEVWVMENYGVATSWAKRHVISKYDGDNIVPVGFTLNNQFLFGHGIHLSMYDSEASIFRYFKGFKFRSHKDNDVDPFYEGVYPFSNSTKVVQYVDSLVWVTPSKWAYNDVCITN